MISYQAEVCAYRVKHAYMLHLTITQHTASFFSLLAARKLDVPYIFSYADGHITGTGTGDLWCSFEGAAAQTATELRSLMLYS